MTFSLPIRESVDVYYMRMAHLVSTRATCVRRSVGCVVTDKKNRVISTGYNGGVSGTTHCTDSPCEGANLKSGTGLDLCQAIHAEVNAVSQAECKLPFADKLYCTASPCISCMKLILTTSIRAVYYTDEYPGFDSVRRLWSQLRDPANLIKMPDKYDGYTESPEGLSHS